MRAGTLAQSAYRQHLAFIVPAAGLTNDWWEADQRHHQRRYSFRAHVDLEHGKHETAPQLRIGSAPLCGGRIGAWHRVGNPVGPRLSQSLPKYGTAPIRRLRALRPIERRSKLMQAWADYLARSDAVDAD